MRRQLTLVAIVVAFAAGGARAGGPSNTTEVGPRQIGMGGAFVGLADDAYAIYYNPAGLPRLQRQEFTGGYIPARLFGNMYTAYGAATLPFGESQAIGADFFFDSYDDSDGATPLSDDLMSIRGSYGVLLHRSLSIGGNAKYISETVNYLGSEVDKMTGFGFDVGGVVDFGGLFRPLEGLRFGAMARDVGGTSVKHDNDRSEVIYPARYTLGLSYMPIDNLVLATDVTLEDRVHVGAEYVLANILALRGGMARDIGDVGTDMLFSAGVGLKFKGFAVDYAFQSHPVFEPMHYFGISFAYNPSYITIRDARVKPTPIFRALYRTYETDPEFAEVTLKNTAQEPLDVSVGLRLPTMMAGESFHSQDFTIPAQSTETVTLGVTVDDSLLIRESSNYDNVVQPEVTVRYRQQTEDKTTGKQLESVYVLGRNKMTWEDPLRVCTFVTPDHTNVIEFGDWTVREFGARRDEVFSRCPNLGTAMAIFDALGKYGIHYNPDQTTPYYKIASDTTNMRTIFDTIKFPVDLLRSRLGDCDDCTILFVSLLEQQNISTALLDVFDPVWGHVYMMFDSGLTPEEALESGLFLDESEFVAWADPADETGATHAWIPVETTMFGHSFTDAWISGVEEYYEREAREFIRVWSVREGRQRYQAGTVDAMNLRTPPAGEVSELLELDITEFMDRLALPEMPASADAEAWYERGVLLVERTQYEAAINAFSRATQIDPFMADAYNGRGVARNYEGGRLRYLSDDPAMRREQAEAQWRAAVQDFRQAIDYGDASSAYYWMNLMISYQLLNSTEEARQAREQALDIDEGLAPMLDGILQGAE